MDATLKRIKWKMTKVLKMSFKILLVIITISIIFVIICRAQCWQIEFDEAVSYMLYAKEFSFHDIQGVYDRSIANNHWLNTVLIHAVQGVTKQYYNDFLIRLPNVLAGFVYIGTVLAFYFRSRNRFTLLLPFLLLLNNEAEKYFSKARGFGIALAAVMAVFLFYQLWIDEKLENDWMIRSSVLMFTIANYAVVSMIFTFASFSIIVFWKLWQSGYLFTFLKRNLWFIIFICSLEIWIFRYGLFISSNNFPLPCFEGNFIDAMFQTPVSMYVTGILQNIVTFLVVVFFVSSLILFRKKIAKAEYIPILVIYLMIIFLLHIFFDIDYPVLRLTIPVMPLYILSFAEIGSWVRLFLKEHGTSAVMLGLKGAWCGILILLSYSFCKEQMTSVYKVDTPIRDDVYKAAFSDGILDMKNKESWPIYPYYEGQIYEKYGVSVVEKSEE